MIYAIVWRATAPPEEFERRIPGLMQWLKELHGAGRLRACGGWLEDEGGLTLIEADSLDEAKSIDARNPLSEIGTSEIHAWDLYYADLHKANAF
jgi:uncharacterized protein YciI